MLAAHLDFGVDPMEEPVSEGGAILFAVLIIGGFIVYHLSPERNKGAWFGIWVMGFFGFFCWRNTFLDYSDGMGGIGNIIFLALAIAFSKGTYGYIKELKD